MTPVEAAKRIRQGASTVVIDVHWGKIEWRRSSETILGLTKDRQPFTIRNVYVEELLLWLEGALIQAAFRQMKEEDRELLLTGLP